MGQHATALAQQVRKGRHAAPAGVHLEIENDPDPGGPLRVGGSRTRNGGWGYPARGEEWGSPSRPIAKFTRSFPIVGVQTKYPPLKSALWEGVHF